MYRIILAAIVELFKALIPLVGQKINEPRTAMDAPAVPKHIRDAWLRGASSNNGPRI